MAAAAAARCSRGGRRRRRPWWGGRGTGCEPRVVAVEEDAAQREREEVRAQEAAGVDDARGATPCRRSGTLREATRREAAEDGREHVVRQRRRHIHRLSTSSSLDYRGKLGNSFSPMQLIWAQPLKPREVVVVRCPVVSLPVNGPAH
ncbi:hypothetical protein OsI_25141 [Oryza sativa Indica Group]|uniref:Uncharacterized protein n=1 Tax=Oryza sativa subsp. indica TaxID=39946 RepID=A2YIT9_ORYSI|nr:hypothetical protein OsI_25141 [Oryza sativa Indica Group]